ncbi:molybdenum cofactor guanylyltransferase MobA [Thauera sinica]|uniref:Molybdenum cofactor guanylyltransferase n=1 Tax=Thauera sinica TaxID=2665146 RepID=A0ABW1AV34_9RHOO
MTDQTKPRPRITGVLLAGGQGQRMGGVDKGLMTFDGRPLAAHVLARLAPQVDELLVNANRNLSAWQAFGYPVFADDIPGYIGPLAGLHAALSRAAHPLVVTVPCDAPFLPGDLVLRLLSAWQGAGAGADVAVAKTAGRLHPVFCLCRREHVAHLDAYLAAGGRRVERWSEGLRVVEVGFDDQPAAFLNLNTPDELVRALAGTGHGDGR